MRKFILLVPLFILLFPSLVHASYVTVGHDGKVILHVLAEKDEHTGNKMQVMKLSENNVNAPPAVTLTKEKGTVQMVVTNTDGTKELHIPQKTDTLVEIEERPETQKISIGVQADQFFLREKNYIALTSYPLKIDARSAHLVASPDTGDTLLSILPMEAAEAALRSGIISKITDNTMELLEDDNKLQYKIAGVKVFSLLHIYDYTVPVDTYVSVSDGSIERVDSSTWYKFVNFLVG